MTFRIPFVVRTKKDEDKGYIWMSWKMGVRSEPPYKAMTDHIFDDYAFQRLSPVVNEALAYVAVNPDDEDHIMGFALWSATEYCPTLHWLYVKDKFRKFGIGAVLLEKVLGTNTRFDFSHGSQEFNRRLYRLGGRFNPLSVWIGPTYRDKKARSGDKKKEGHQGEPIPEAA